MKQGIIKNNVSSGNMITKRFCRKCNKPTEWNYNPISNGVGHSYCSLCGFMDNTSIKLQEQTNMQKMESMKITIQNQKKEIGRLEKKIIDLNIEIVVLELKLSKCYETTNHKQ